MRLRVFSALMFSWMVAVVGFASAQRLYSTVNTGPSTGFCTVPDPALPQGSTPSPTLASRIDSFAMPRENSSTNAITYELRQKVEPRMRPYPKMSRQLERREFFERWLGSYRCRVDPGDQLAADGWASSPSKLASSARTTGASLRDISRGRPESTACVEIARLQELYFPEVTIIAYAYALCSAMTNTYRQQGFTMPIPPDTLVAERGIICALLLPNKKTQHV